MSKSPTSRTLDRIRQLGAVADISESHNTFSGKKKDLFGFIDVVALVGKEIVGIQVTSAKNHATRIRKIKEECRDAALAWLAAGGAIEVWSWAKYDDDDERRKWRERITEIKREDLEA